MGDIADMMMDGILDEYTGEYIGPAVGYPRSRDPEHYSNQRYGPKHPGYGKNPYWGIQKWVMMNTGIRHQGKVWKAIRRYAELKQVEEPENEVNGTPNHLATWIQHGQWVEFTKWVKETYNK